MLSIDPGTSGGIAFYTSDITGVGVIGAFKMPDTDREIADLLERPRVAGQQTVYLEDIVKFAGRNMPSSSMATYAGNWGFIRGVLTAYQYRIILVPPKIWQKALGLGSAKGMTKTQWKNKLKNRAEQLFPNIKVTLNTADALLILEAARRGLLD